eukprot:scaffold345_cov134-Cylindrotheca_fusiformis.AAC.65
MVVGSSTGAASVAPITTMASAMFFGTIIFATAAMATRGYLTADHMLFKTAANPRSSALDVRSLNSMYTLLYHSSVMGLILFYAYICEYHPPYAHADKNYDADLFFFCTFLLFVISAYTWRKHVNVDDKDKKLKSKQSVEDVPADSDKSSALEESNDKTEILNRDQTEEWKGWMQFMFLLYHYYHAEPVYNSIRIMITCYVWMTGFGNFSFFYLKGDFGAVRVLQMLWRLNFLVLFLCLTQGTTYILYYICLLHTYFFLMVYVVMRIGYKNNHTKWWVRIKMILLGLAIFLVWDCNLGLFKLIHLPFFGTTPMMGATSGSMWEWYFRSSLDHWSTFLGMIFALNFPISSLFYRKLEAQPLLFHILGKALVGAALLVAFFFWVTGPFMQDKLNYNQTNAYYGFIPLIVYIYFRNLTPYLRNHSMDLLHQIGKTTLETYLMQHHIWLTSNAKSLLTLVPGWPKINFLLVSLIYVYLSRRLYSLTLFLRGMVLPDNKSACYKNLIGMGFILASFCLLAVLLNNANMMTLKVVGVVSVTLGYTLFQFLLSFTARPGGTIEAANPSRNNQGLALTTPYLGGALAVLFIGMSWNHMARFGATRIQPLPATCSDFANEGDWVPINGCDEGSRGEAYRNLGISTETTCNSQNKAFAWGWYEQDPKLHCRFKQRDVKSLKKTLQGRSVVFAGDSITRYAYHSFCRQLGIQDAGAYNATQEKHESIHRDVGDISVDFVWAGYSSELLEEAKKILKSSDGNKTGPDLVVLGGGAWDRLWEYETEKQKSQMKSYYNSLAATMVEIKKLSVPVVWIRPTTINSPALPSELKRANINENEMVKFRSIQEEAGVPGAASFVIDGPGFTSARVAESFDGVHYPHQVYSAGSQILANALDWLLPDRNISVEPKAPPEPGSMSHFYLGIMILVFSLFGIVGFDGFMGFSYVAAIFLPSMAPFRLFHEAFSTLHQRKNLPPLGGPNGGLNRPASSVDPSGGNEDLQEDDEETGPLLESDSMAAKDS